MEEEVTALLPYNYKKISGVTPEIFLSLTSRRLSDGYEISSENTAFALCKHGIYDA